ncbi:MAG: UvrD-helicase domain-containing protein, partial [Acidimicrobiales bacterium]
MLRLRTAPTATPSPAPAPRQRPRWPAIAPGSVAAQVLAATWAGERAITVASPPGAGKTALICQVAAHLAGRAHLRVVVATFTKSQARELCNRLVAAGTGYPVTLYGA